MFVMFLWISLFIAQLSVVLPCNLTCVNGACQTQNGQDKCICNKGWHGPTCNLCGGRLRLNGSSGVVSDGSGNYSQDMTCTWLIDAPTLGGVLLQFDSFATECGWDYLYIYDGDSAFAPMVAALSGIESTNSSQLSVMTRSGSVYMHFFSDAAYTMSGFSLTYSVVQCPYKCSGHGTCSAASGKCSCSAGWVGEGCERPACPSNCGGAPCAQCVPDCGSSTKGCWMVLWTDTSAPSSPAIPVLPGMASHRSALVDDRYMWIVSGYSFTMNRLLSVTFYDLSQSPVPLQQFILPQRFTVRPLARYGHSVVLFNKNQLLVYGGVTEDGVTGELWQFDTLQLVWTLLTNGSVPSSSVNVSGLAVAGHTAHLINSTMVVLFGHSPLYGFVNIVQEYDTVSRSWSVVNTSGALVPGSYGHTSVYDSNSRLIFVHGGYMSTNYSSSVLLDGLYSYDPAARIWTILPSSGHQRFLHSAVILNGLMMVFGGNTHNDTQYSQGAKCQSSDLLAYDLECQQWYEVGNADVGVDVSRFGQTAEVYQGKIYFHGGFNGMFLNDFVIFTPVKCQVYTSKEDCESTRQGIQCVWADDKTCLSLSGAQALQGHKFIEQYAVASCTPPPADAISSMCAAQKTCTNCVQTSMQCVWCGSSCQPSSSCTSSTTVLQQAVTVGQCVNVTKAGSDCDLRHNCMACERDSLCVWDKRDSVCLTQAVADIEVTNSSQCDLPCSARTSCDNCTSASCMWCVNEQVCIESNSYVINFPYGQCTEWTTRKANCAGTFCSELRTCADCEDQAYCGWCDDGSDRGLGSCMDGAARGPVVNGSVVAASNQTCPVFRWHFTDCPLCQCNGHSTCTKGTANCIQCEDNTTGPQCQYCADSYWGTPTNGANCTACSCNDQAVTCDRTSGKCFCMTKGVTGDSCDSCDTAHKYFGDPNLGGTCYYQLTADFQFTFNLSKDDDKYISRVNFMYMPQISDRDVDFTINCSSSAAVVNVTVNASGIESLVHNFDCRYFHEKFSFSSYNFSSKSNTTIYVYVYNFKTPFLVTVAFSQFPQIDLLHFFITFFSCFLSLLLVAAILWKVKQRWDQRRRRRLQMLELQKMAKRPFAVISVQLSDIALPTAAALDKIHVTFSDSTADSAHNSHQLVPVSGSVAVSNLSRCAVTVQPTADHKAAIVSAFIRLPGGSANSLAPPGAAGLAIATTLVSLGNQRRGSGDLAMPMKDKEVLKRRNKFPFSRRSADRTNTALA